MEGIVCEDDSLDRVPMLNLVELMISTVEAATRTGTRSPQSIPGTASVAQLHLLLLPLLQSFRTRVASTTHLREVLARENEQLKSVLDEMTALAHDQRQRLERGAADVALLSEQLVREAPALSRKSPPLQS